MASLSLSLSLSLCHTMAGTYLLALCTLVLSPLSQGATKELREYRILDLRPSTAVSAPNVTC